MTYSTDFRRKVLEVKEEENLTIAEVAARFKEALKQDVELYPDAYHYKRAVRFGITESGIRSALKRQGISYKKTMILVSRITLIME